MKKMRWQTAVQLILWLITYGSLWVVGYNFEYFFPDSGAVHDSP